MACVNVKQKSGERNIAGAEFEDSSSDDVWDEETPGYDCPKKPNITTDWYDIDGGGTYTACRSVSTLGQLLIKGHSVRSSGTYCVFPVQLNGDEDDLEITPLDGRTSTTQDDKTLRYCMKGNSDDTAILQTQGISFNAVFIVDKQYEEQMDICLLTQNDNICPRYSFGSLD